MATGPKPKSRFGDSGLINSGKDGKFSYKIEFSVALVNEIPGVLVLVELGELLPVLRVGLVRLQKAFHLLDVD